MQNLSHIRKGFVEYIGRKESQPSPAPSSYIACWVSDPYLGEQSRSLQLKPVTQAS